MGVNQSKASLSQLANEKIIIERLHALQMKDSSAADNEYVYVGSNEKQHQPASSSAGLSISAIKHWEHELLQDPKNRFVGNFLRSPFPGCSISRDTYFWVDWHSRP